MKKNIFMIILTFQLLEGENFFIDNRYFSDCQSSLIVDNVKIEASAARASIAFARMNIDIPEKYIDSYGLVGFMKGKPVIATAKKILQFMLENHKTTPIILDAPCYESCIQKFLLGKKGLYIFIPNDSKKFGISGYVTLGDGEYKEKINKHFYMANKGKIYLFE